MLKIRLMRIGAKKRPFYRVVVIDERAKRNGAYLELLGTYNPLTTPHEIILKKDRIDHWLKMGAVKSDGFLRIIGEAPQRPPRKAKKVKKESTDVSLQSSVEPQPEAGQPVAETTEEKPVEEAPKEETPTEAPAQKVPAQETSAPENQPETTESADSVIPSESEESLANASQNESGDSSPAEPVQNDKVEEKEIKDEGSA